MSATDARCFIVEPEERGTLSVMAVAPLHRMTERGEAPAIIRDETKCAGILCAKVNSGAFQNHLLLKCSDSPSLTPKNEAFAGSLAASFLEQLALAGSSALTQRSSEDLAH